MLLKSGRVILLPTTFIIIVGVKLVQGESTPVYRAEPMSPISNPRPYPNKPTFSPSFSDSWGHLEKGLNVIPHLLTTADRESIHSC